MKLLVLLAFIGSCVAQICLLTVPPAPLTATGLATPYTQTGCTMAGGTPSFVQGAVFDINTGAVSVYNPLVIDAGTTAGCTPLVPGLVQGAVVALWFGTNGNTLTLVDKQGSLAAGFCVNGFTDPITQVLSIFGQFAYCNAVTFFDQVKASPLVNPPPLGIATNDGQACPTTRDFFVVDMDPNDNVISTYLLLNNGLVCQNTTTNFLAKSNMVTGPLANGSDERLLLAFYKALGGCKPWTGVDLAEGVPNLGVVMVPSVAHNEIQADRLQLPPIALEPLNNPMTLVNAQPSLAKTNLYRIGVGQPRAQTVRDADGSLFCFYYYTTQPLRLLKNMGTFVNFPSPDPAAGNSLFTFLAQRFFNSFGKDGLDCVNKLQIPQPGPITITLDGNGVAIAALVIPPNNGIGGGNPSAFTTPIRKNDAPATAGGWSTTMIVAALLLLSGLIV